MCDGRTGSHWTSNARSSLRQRIIGVGLEHACSFFIEWEENEWNNMIPVTGDGQ